MIYHPPVILSKLRPARTDDLGQEAIRKRPALQKADQLEQVRQLAEKTNFANSLSEKKPAAPVAPTNALKGGRPPDFDLDDSIKWMGREV
jgi:hypothetical protein